MPEWDLKLERNRRGRIDNSFVDLKDLNDSINQKSNVVEADSDDLNGVVQTECVPYQEDLVQETQSEQGEIRDDCFGGLVAGCTWFEMGLKSAKDISVRVGSVSARYTWSIAPKRSYPSKARPIAACAMVTSIKLHVQVVFGVYIMVLFIFECAGAGGATSPCLS